MRTNRYRWVLRDVEVEKTISSHEAVAKLSNNNSAEISEVSRIISAAMRDDEPEVERISLAGFYVLNHDSGHKGFRTLNLKNGKRTGEQIEYAQSIISSCLSSEYGFFVKGKAAIESTVCITSKGKTFAGIDGLFVEGAKYLTPLGTLGVGALITTIIGATLKAGGVI